MNATEINRTFCQISYLKWKVAVKWILRKTEVLLDFWNHHVNFSSFQVFLSVCQDRFSNFMCSHHLISVMLFGIQSAIPCFKCLFANLLTAPVV